MLNVSELPAAAARLSDVGETDNVTPAPLCVTVTVFEATPVPEMVTVAVLDDVFVFSWAVTVTVPLFEPDVGLTDNHV